ncbi:MAG TPA: hypothetical protein VIF82_19135 [Burkholderiaceae bacterium]|jgi:hypothetical protein
MNQTKNETQNHELVGTIAGAGMGAATGVGGTVAAVSSLGVAGLSGPGIVSGLAALGGGSMLGGLVVATGGTALLVGGLGYAGYCIAKKLKNDAA